MFAYVGPPASRYQQLAAPSSVYQRSLACDLEWPRYSSVSSEERELGLAYVITAFSDPRNLELSLATIFRPHNSYCIHIDTKSDLMFRCLYDINTRSRFIIARYVLLCRESVENMLGCYRQRHPGTYIYPAREAVAVHWGHFSIVEAELSCLQDLLHNNRSWQYALDMAGSEDMMFTNR